MSLKFPFEKTGLAGREEAVHQGNAESAASKVLWPQGIEEMPNLESTSDPAAVMRKMIEIFATGDIGEAGSVVSTAYVDHQEPAAGSDGIGTFQFVVTRVRQAFPDLKVYIEELFSERDRVVARLLWTATDSTGKSFEAESIDILRVVDGKAAEHWGINRGWPPRA